MKVLRGLLLILVCCPLRSFTPLIPWVSGKANSSWQERAANSAEMSF